MSEGWSRLLFLVEWLLCLPVLACAFVLAFGLFAMNTCCFLGPGLLGLLFGGIRSLEDAGVLAGLVGMEVGAVCAVVALGGLVRVSALFLFRGRRTLPSHAGILRWSSLAALPPLLARSLPDLAAQLAADPRRWDAVEASLCYGGLPLLIPAAHLFWEARRIVFSITPSFRSRPPC